MADCAGWVQCISEECALAALSLPDPDKAAGLEEHTRFHSEDIQSPSQLLKN